LKQRVKQKKKKQKKKKKSNPQIPRHPLSWVGVLGAERGSGVVFGGGFCGVLTRPTKGNFSQKFGFDGKVRKISNAKNEPTRARVPLVTFLKN
jgi:hypothetical protein